MSGTETDPSRDTGKQEQARKLARDGLQAQQAGDDATADRLLGQALQHDPDAVADVLRATGADTPADARDIPTDRAVTRTPDR
jgi:Tfp pilus assembly protein PilF